jgi:nitrogen-specific signal transduction histidine kinase
MSGGADRLRLGRLESLSALAGGVTHELSNLAASVMMSVQLLEPSCREPADRQILASLDELAQRLQQAGRQLHWLARGIAGETTVFQPQYLLTDLQRLARVAFPAPITVVTRYPPDLWPVAGDPLIVYQLLLDLCLEAGGWLRGAGTLVLAAGNQELAGAAGGGERRRGRYVVLAAIAEAPAALDAGPGRPARPAERAAAGNGPGGAGRTPNGPAGTAMRRRAAAGARRAAAAAGGFTALLPAGSTGRGRRAYPPAAPGDEPAGGTL